MLNSGTGNYTKSRRRAIPVEADSAVLRSPFDTLRVGVEMVGGRITAINFLAGDAQLLNPATVAGRVAVDQLRRYFRDPAFQFTVPLAPRGTAFQQRVWRAMRDIPAGSVCSYGDLARRLTTSARAVGGACRHNPVPIIIPCHRVVSSSALGGFCGQTNGPMLELKARLLAHERGQ